ncbi:MAG: VCBS repeat-containing protein, partial [Bacteroidales bacterium]|nr:VCBS repeat-containing protein [Bacteroidales bacterium]
MKILKILTVILAILLMAGCRESEDKKKQKATDLITIRTLGLAYLEEFKLEEAEKEFIKFIKLAPDQKLGYANLGLTYLRMGKYKDAEKQLFKAIKIDPADPDTRLILATVYQMDNDPDKAIQQLQDALKYSPDHIKTLYALAEIFSARADETSQNLRREYLMKLVEKAPANLVVHLELTEILIRKGEYDNALSQLELIKKQFPEFHKDANDYYLKTINSLRNNDNTDLLNNFIIFHNYLKVTTPYQAGITELKGPGGSLIGFPVITFDDKTLSQVSEYKSMLDALSFSDVTTIAGLEISGKSNPAENAQLPYKTTIASSDYDGDGDVDLFICTRDNNTSLFKCYLFNDKMGRFEDVASKAGIKETGNVTSAEFADYDNDGFPDLLLLTENSARLYSNTGNGT